MQENLENVKEQMSGEELEHLAESETHDENNEAKDPREDTSNPIEDKNLDLFKLVFEAAQKPDEESKKLQRRLTWVLTGALCIQVAWALILIPILLATGKNISTTVLSFVTLLVTAVLAEVVAMAFFVVKFVFRTPLDTMIDLLKEIINKQK